MAEKRGGIIAGLIVGAVLLFACGAAVSQFLFPPRPPATLQAGSAVNSFDVETAEFDDARTVPIAFEASADVTLTLPKAGRVTQTSCQVGGTIASGQLVARVDGIAILALSTQVPLWRAASWGDTGEDVAALRAELNRLGAGIAETGGVNTELLNALAARLVPEGSKAPTLESIPTDRILWLPAPEVSMLSCDATVASNAEAGGTFGKIRGTLSKVSVTELPQDLAPGPRTLRVSGITVAVDDTGVVTAPESLAELAASPMFQSKKQSDTDQKNAAISGVLALAEASQVSAVPPATVFAIDGSTGCVTSKGTDTRVRIVGSKLGKTYITPVQEQTTLPKIVDVPSDTSRKCSAA